ncbi:MAG: hypothetical protein ACLUE8_14075 [Lachnospiraceae bacterium]
MTDPGLIWYTGAVPPQDTLVDASSTTGKALKWRYTADQKIQVLGGDEVVAEFSYSSAADLGDWSTHLPVKKQPTPTPVPSVTPTPVPVVPARFPRRRATPLRCSCWRRFCC